MERLIGSIRRWVLTYITFKMYYSKWMAMLWTWFAIQQLIVLSHIALLPNLIRKLFRQVSSLEIIKKISITSATRKSAARSFHIPSIISLTQHRVPKALLKLPYCAWNFWVLIKAHKSVHFYSTEIRILAKRVFYTNIILREVYG